jgi:hypothetical protein
MKTNVLMALLGVSMARHHHHHRPKGQMLFLDSSEVPDVAIDPVDKF